MHVHTVSTHRVMNSIVALDFHNAVAIVVIVVTIAIATMPWHCISSSKEIGNSSDPTNPVIVDVRLDVSTFGGGGMLDADAFETLHKFMKSCVECKCLLPVITYFLIQCHNEDSKGLQQSSHRSQLRRRVNCHRRKPPC